MKRRPSYRLEAYDGGSGYTFQVYVCVISWFWSEEQITNQGCGLDDTALYSLLEANVSWVVGRR